MINQEPGPGIPRHPLVLSKNACFALCVEYKWFGGGGYVIQSYVIAAVPYKDGGMWQLAGVVSKDGKEHRFVRADKFNSPDEAADIAISKGQLIVDQSGDSIFK